MYYCYVLRLVDGTYYICFSENLRNRLKDHVNGRIDTTKDKFQKLAFYCAFVSKKKALAFEKYLKTCSGFAFRNKHLI